MTSGIVRSLRRYLPRRERPTQRVALGLAIAALVFGTLISIVNKNSEVKIAAVVVIVVVLSSLVLSMAGMLIELAVVACCLIAMFVTQGISEQVLSYSGYAIILVTALVGVLQARRRDALGLREVSAETVIGLISERLLVQTQLPEVPDGWLVEIEQRPAHGAAICGDFVANRLIGDGESAVLHLAVVDVSGSGIAAGPRALLLSGAVGGLLGAVPPEEFLPAANDYLARQQWSLGFASAIYLCLDLHSGEYGLRAAGHPPAMQFRPSQLPAWRTSTATGTVLGVLPELTGTPEYGTLLPGESMFLYTDGVIEDRARGLDAGTQRFKQNVELLVDGDTWDGAARYLVERVPTELADDRTVVVIRRSPVPAERKPAPADGEVVPAR
ncbi:MAG TPA: PP2C family protein-serine/threonine phosphatase [Jatrophihabitans sp.]|nr:PP2C family protein-serine/threonine phosphatase [Jatrophihabitans sp.]